MRLKHGANFTHAVSITVHKEQEECEYLIINNINKLQDEEIIKQIYYTE